MSEIEELPQETQILMIRASKILQTESKARTAPSNHMVPATKVASADSNRALSIAGFLRKGNVRNEIAIGSSIQGAVPLLRHARSGGQTWPCVRPPVQCRTGPLRYDVVYSEIDVVYSEI